MRVITVIIVQVKLRYITPFLFMFDVSIYIFLIRTTVLHRYNIRLYEFRMAIIAFVYSPKRIHQINKSPINNASIANRYNGSDTHQPYTYMK